MLETSLNPLKNSSISLPSSPLFISKNNFLSLEKIFIKIPKSDLKKSSTSLLSATPKRNVNFQLKKNVFVLSNYIVNL